MTDLLSQQCVPCSGNAPLATDAEIATMRTQIPDWLIVDKDGVKRLRRTYEFKNFVSALAFTNAVGEIAEEAGHHPVLTTEWGKTTVEWWSHEIGGLHQNDFILAAKTDAIAQK